MSRSLLIPAAVFYTILLSFLSLAPSLLDNNFTWEISSGMEPKEGDNFKVANRPAVFKLENGIKHQYLTESSYHSYPENRSFDTPYELGGILICDKSTVDAIPDGKFMPFRPGMKYIERSELSHSIWASVFKLDKLSHFIAYFLYSLILLVTIRTLKGSISVNHYIWMFIYCLLFGFGLEIAQYLTATYRDPEILDILFNSIGVIAGSIFFMLNEKRIVRLLDDTV